MFVFYLLSETESFTWLAETSRDTSQILRNSHDKKKKRKNNVDYYLHIYILKSPKDTGMEDAGMIVMYEGGNEYEILSHIINSHTYSDYDMKIWMVRSVSCWRKKDGDVRKDIFNK